MRRVYLFAALLAFAAAVGCQAVDNDPILGKNPFNPSTGFPTAK